MRCRRGHFTTGTTDQSAPGTPVGFAVNRAASWAGPVGDPLVGAVSGLAATHRGASTNGTHTARPSSSLSRRRDNRPGTGIRSTCPLPAHASAGDVTRYSRQARGRTG